MRLLCPSISTVLLAAMVTALGCGNVMDPPPVVDTDEPTIDSTPSFYSVGHYDKHGDPTTDLDETLKQARTEGKRVMLQVGGDWCGWCKLITNYMDTNEKVHKILDDNFVVMKVTSPADNAEAFLSQYPSCEGYPHFFVLENDGTFLHSQGTAELEEGKGYNQERFVAFLEAWIPSNQ